MRGLARGRWDEQPVGPSAADVERRRRLDRQDTAPPVDGRRRRPAGRRSPGEAGQHPRVGRVLRQLGVEAIDPQPRLSPPAAGQVSSPARWRGFPVNRVHQVWRAESPDVRLAGGWVSLVAVLDWCSRDGRSWAVASTMAVACGVEAWEPALRQGQPERFTTDPGAQCTSLACTGRLTPEGLRISMEGRGRALDQVCVERWWRSHMCLLKPPPLSCTGWFSFEPQAAASSLVADPGPTVDGASEGLCQNG